MTPTKVLFCAALATLFLATHAMGAVVTWDTHAAYQVDANDPTQISTLGTLITAVAISSTTTNSYYNPNTNGGSPVGTQTVNGVPFTAYALVPNTPGVLHAISPNASIAFQAGGWNNPATPSTAYTALLETGIYQPDTSTSSSPIEFNGLVVGHAYQVQLWNSYWPTPTNTVRFSDTAPTFNGTSWHSANESQTLLVGQSGTSLTPQYTFGQFTATDTTQDLYWYGDLSNYGIFGAFQLRDLGAVPEPTTVALFAFGGLALILRRRFRVSGQPDLVA